MKRGKSGEGLINPSALNQQQAAYYCEVTARAFRDWNVPRNPDGSYELLTVLRFERARRGTGAGELDLTTERARLAKWQADKTHQDVEIRAGKLLLEDDVRQWVAGMIAVARQRLVQIPETVRQVVHPDHAEGVTRDVRRLIYEALAELEARGSSAPRPDVVALGTAAEPDGEPVGGPVSKTVKRKQRRARPVEN